MLHKPTRACMLEDTLIAIRAINNSDKGTMCMEKEGQYPKQRQYLGQVFID